MRTSAILALVLAALVLVGGVLSLRVMAGISGEYAATARELTALAREKDWQRAAEVVQARYRSWKKTVDWLQMLVDHADTDAVTLGLRTIAAGIEAQDLSACLAACAELEEAAEHIYHRDAFTLGNIL